MFGLTGSNCCGCYANGDCLAIAPDAMASSRMKATLPAGFAMAMQGYCCPDLDVSEMWNEPYELDNYLGGSSWKTSRALGPCNADQSCVVTVTFDVWCITAPTPYAELHKCAAALQVSVISSSKYAGTWLYPVWEWGKANYSGPQFTYYPLGSSSWDLPWMDVLPYEVGVPEKSFCVVPTGILPTPGNASVEIMTPPPVGLDMQSALAICRQPCTHRTLIRDGAAEICRPDLFDPEQGKNCERRAVQIWRERLYGKRPPCPKWRRR